MAINAQTRVYIPSLGRFVTLHDRLPMKRGHTHRRSSRWPAVALPIDRVGGLAFPVDGNNDYGDCGAAMAAHVDNTWTGLNGHESVIDPTALVQQYLAQSHGDNGLSEEDVLAIWTAGLAGDPAATIYEHLDIDPLDPTAMASAIDNFGAVCLGVSLLPSWANAFKPGMIWTLTGERASPAYGHFVALNGVNAKGYYHVETWGYDAWLDPAAMHAIDPSGFVAFSPRQFKPDGTDWAGRSYTRQASLWRGVGGSVLPPSPFGPTPPPAPVPGPAPVPTPPPSPGPATVPLALSMDDQTWTAQATGPVPTPSHHPLHKVVIQIGPHQFFGVLKG